MSEIISSLLSRLSSKKFLFSAGTLIGLFVLLNYVVLPLYVYHGGTLQVPDVTGLPLELARERIVAIGLEPVEADTRPDAKQPIGSISGQNPVPGSVVKYGRRVYLNISGGEVLVTVPSLRGRSTRDGKFSLERNGLQMGRIEYAYSETYPENTIIDQSVTPDSKVSKGSLVNVRVSQGKESGEKIVPDLTGRTLSEAERTLLEGGFRIGNISYQSSSILVPNTIVDQYPRPGELVTSDQLVDLFVVRVGQPVEEFPTP